MTGIEILVILYMLIPILLVLSAAGILVWKNFKNDHSIRVEWDKVAKFLAFMTLVTMLRICFADLIESFVPGFVSGKVDAIAGKIGFASLPFVFWEDVFFGMPIAYIMRKWLPTRPKLAITLTILISTIFMAGHLYQGYMGLVAILYPFFVSYRYGKKYGFGTVMVCHMLYDFITMVTMKTYHLLLM